MERFRTLLPWILVVVLSVLCAFYASEASRWEKACEESISERENLEAEYYEAMVKGEDKYKELSEDYSLAMGIIEETVRLLQKKGVEYSWEIE